MNNNYTKINNNMIYNGTAVYVGAGISLEPLKYITANKIVCIDSQPFSELGKEKDIINKNICNCIFPFFSTSDNENYRPNFICMLKESAKKNNYKLIKISNNKYTFQNKDTNQIIIYLINTSIPDDLNEIIDEIYNFDNLIVMGVDPDKKLLKYTNKKITFWGNINTVYLDNFKNRDLYNHNIVKCLNDEYDFNYEFNSFNLIDQNNEIKKFRSWKNFKEYIIGKNN